MIRMGRSSKTEPANEIKQNFQEQPQNSPYSANGENLASSSRGLSESETMARDIKEGRLSGFVGGGTVLTGDISFQTMLRIDGQLTGRVISEKGTIIIGATGQVDANIAVAAAVINGTVNGDIIATEKLQLGRTAHVVGNVQTPRLLLEDGAILEGNCSMMKARDAIEKRTNETQKLSSANDAAMAKTADGSAAKSGNPSEQKILSGVAA